MHLVSYKEKLLNEGRRWAASGPGQVALHERVSKAPRRGRAGAGKAGVGGRG